MNAFLNFVENDTDYLVGTKTILDAPNFSPEYCSVYGDGIPNPVNINVTVCEFGLHNNFQVKISPAHNFRTLANELFYIIVVVVEREL